MEKIIYVGSAYLAPVEYYTKLLAYDKVYVERYDNYVKQTYRNRCVIAAADGPLALTVPTEKISIVLSLIITPMTSVCFMRRNILSYGISIRNYAVWCAV